jgi:glycosyltransferase involved in cell wall biosynthesis
MTARYLADCGYQVDMFVEYDEKMESRSLCLPETIHPNIRTHAHVLDPSVRPLITRKGIRLSRKDSSAVLDIARASSGDYAWLIGFDPNGLARAAALSELWERPYVYHNLEIEEASSQLKPLEIVCNKNALYTLTQDDCRADILSRLNMVPRDKVFISLNSSLGDVLPERDDFFRDLFPEIGSRTIILTVGTLARDFCCTGEIVVSTRNWGEKYVLVMHGWLYPEDFGKEVKKFVASVDNVFLSENIVPPEQKFRIFQSVDVCLVFFSDKFINTRYAAPSAGKLYDCMRCGVPVIGNDIPGMRDLVEKNGIGLVVRDASQIHVALPQIKRRHDFFRQNCLATFPRYEFSKSYAPILSMTERLVGNSPR